MKASFYFVLWIIVYPLLGLIPSQFVHDYSFFAACFIVWGLAAVLNHLFGNTFAYARTVQMMPVLEEVYTSNVEAFRKRLTREVVIAIVTSLYFCVTTAIIVTAAFTGQSGGFLELVIFGAFTIAMLGSSVKLFKAWQSLKANPTKDTCETIAMYTMRLPYEEYSQARFDHSYGEMFPPRPRYYSVYIVFSVIFSVAAVVLGLIFMVLGIIIFFGSSGVEAGSVAGMYLLYGALALYYGVRDLVTKER